MDAIEELKRFALRTGTTVTLPDGTIFNSSKRKIHQAKLFTEITTSVAGRTNEIQPTIDEKDASALVSAVNSVVNHAEQQTAAINKMAERLTVHQPVMGYDVFFNRKDGKIVSAKIVPILHSDVTPPSGSNP